MGRSGNITLSVQKVVTILKLGGFYWEGPDMTYPMHDMVEGQAYTLKAGWVYRLYAWIEDEQGFLLTDFGFPVDLYENGVKVATVNTNNRSASYFPSETDVYIAIGGDFVYYAEWAGTEIYEGCASLEMGSTVVGPPFPWWLFGLMGVIVGVPIVYFLVAKPKGKEIA